jgi:hypothetical protein
MFRLIRKILDESYTFHLFHTSFILPLVHFPVWLLINFFFASLGTFLKNIKKCFI